MTRDRRRVNERFADVLEAIENIKSDLGEFGRDEFLTDGKTQRAVIESLIVMGEAGKRILELEPGLQTRQPELWQHLRDPYDMRIVLTHEYFRVDPTIVWTTLQCSVPELERHLVDWLSCDPPS
ncbi:HepT-like ribonuclease domain-containing protein [Methylotetracoccus oryzae]|uniref:HepT-like ribonuclease domain-containing protein n=1 Tax=Methylotetracoccus oryzae TaxID=1919059 RepID=UPI001119C9EA|nr:HepT-like ribonuclease domain-containing protein [Methylotetracoccus oryzae]